jgi:pimeloyl-ACP methyl ester carboxylesterase
MRTRRVDLGDVALEVAEAGEGGRPVLLVHGFTADHHEVADVMPALAERGWHAVAPDLRGHGRSDHPTSAEGYSLKIMAADVVALADALGWDRFVLLGHSMGGAVAQYVALDHPERLDGLVLAGTFHGPVPGITMDLIQLGTWVVREAGMSGLADAQAARRAENPDSIAAFERLQEARPGYVEEHRARFEATSPDMWTAMAPQFVDQEDRLDRLAKVEVPTAVIVGELDGTMGDDCRRLAATIPGSLLTVIPGVGHVPQLEDPDAWWAAVSGFLSGL